MEGEYPREIAHSLLLLAKKCLAMSGEKMHSLDHVAVSLANLKYQGSLNEDE